MPQAWPSPLPRLPPSSPTSHDARYGAAHGIFGTIYDVGDAIGPIVAGLLVAQVGYSRMFQVMATAVFLMATAFALASRSTPFAPGPRTPDRCGGDGCARSEGER